MIFISLLIMFELLQPFLDDFDCFTFFSEFPKLDTAILFALIVIIRFQLSSFLQNSTNFYPWHFPGHVIDDHTQRKTCIFVNAFFIFYRVRSFRWGGGYYLDTKDPNSSPPANFFVAPAIFLKIENRFKGYMKLIG